jgi:hypothetical protein
LIKTSFSIKLEGDRTFTAAPYLVEAGIIPLSTAQEWDMARPSGFFSLFAISENPKDACCTGQPNVADNVAEWGGWTKGGQIKSFEYTLQVPDSLTQDLCGDEIYWDKNETYVLYVIVKNGCYKDGFRKGVFVSKELTLDVNVTTTSGRECDNDFECVAGEKCIDIEGDFSVKKYCVSSEDPKDLSGLSFMDLKKVPLTKEEISKATTGDLVEAACLSDKECLSVPNHTVSCIRLSKLKEDGLLSDTEESEFFGLGKSSLLAAGIGSGAALTACVAGGVVTGGLVLFACGLGGAILGVTGGEILDVSADYLKDLFSKDDELTKAIKDGDSSKVGICVKERGFDLGGIISKIGRTIKITGNPTTDGWIIIIVGFFLLIIIFRMLGK